MRTEQPSDPVIEEVREVRHRISELCGHDPERLVAYYIEMQRQLNDRLIEHKAPPAIQDQSAA